MEVLSYFVTDYFLQYIYSAPMTKNHQNIKVFNFPSHIFFNVISYGYRAPTLKKKFLRLLPFYMAVATYCSTAIVSFLLHVLN